MNRKASFAAWCAISLAATLAPVIAGSTLADVVTSPQPSDTLALTVSDGSFDCSAVAFNPMASRNTQRAALLDAAAIVGDSGCVDIRLDYAIDPAEHNIYTASGGYVGQPYDTPSAGAAFFERDHDSDDCASIVINRGSNRDAMQQALDNAAWSMAYDGCAVVMFR